MSPAAAVAWEFRLRHRWGLIALIGYPLVIATIKLLVLRRVIPIDLNSPESFAFVVLMPMMAMFTYFLAVFSFGLDGDLAARQSMYPARKFAQPVTTAALVGWTMLYGAVAVMILWLATRLFAPWPSGMVVPSVWPALMAATILAWTQALTWMPYPLPGLRIIVTVLWLGIIDATALLALHFYFSEALVLGILAPQIPLAYLLAHYAVARARRGDVPDWRGAFARRAQIARTPSMRRKDFRSAASAQAWFEWRRYGLSLPAWVGILLPFELMLLWVAQDSAELVFAILLGVLLTPPFMATFAAAAVSKSGSNASDSSYGVTPFIGARPLTNEELVAAKLRMTIRSTSLAWLLVLVAIPLALKLSGASSVVLDSLRRLSDIVGTSRTVVLVLLVLAACIASTWKQLVRSLYLGLSGRASLITGSVLLVLGFSFLLGPFAEWVVESGRLGEVWSALPVIFAVLASLKMIAGIWIVVRLYRGRIVSDRTLVIGAALWTVAVLAVYGVLVWLLDTPHFPHYVLLLLAILAIPLARLSAAPLALAWNRHR